MKALVIAILIATIAFSPLSMAARELVDYGKVSVTVNDGSNGRIWMPPPSPVTNCRPNQRCYPPPTND
ncbi:hypothetical protein POPTR_004G104600v4 [Populus trichocarpa]|uniref:Uncharacterized protein n=1 Tax=Populus trichocarpa TaxID=3694 RepID=A0A2K2ASQ6_POPTR|nr:hypothetical protein POPTR_004G104600v4 [Populus trichocarpa]